MRSGVERSQVSWRLASWRVATMPRSRRVAPSYSPSQMCPRLPVAHAAHRRQPGVERVAAAQRRELCDETVGEHPLEPRLDAPVEGRAVARHERDRHQAERRGAGASAEQPRHRHAGRAPDLERALDALGIGRFQPRGRVRIDLRELGVQRRPAAVPRLGFDCRTQSRVRRGQVRQAFAQRLEVQHRPADEQREVAARRDPAHRRERVGAEPRGGVGRGRIEDVDQMMRHARALGRGRLGGPDVHAAVDLRRVDGDDLDREPARQRRGERRLAARRRTHDQHRRRRPVVAEGGELTGLPSRQNRARGSPLGRPGGLIAPGGTAGRGRRAKAGTRSGGRGCTGRSARFPPCGAGARSSPAP